MMDYVSMYRGKPLDEMTREELIAALEDMGSRERLAFEERKREDAILALIRPKQAP